MDPLFFHNCLDYFCINVYNNTKIQSEAIKMLEMSNKTNLLEERHYKYSLQDVKDPILYRDIYPYEEVPRVAFNHRRVPIGMPNDIWITDTSFRDGQQSVEPYTVRQIVELYKLMSRLGGPFGIIRQTEFFGSEQQKKISNLLKTSELKKLEYSFHAVIIIFSKR